MPSPRLNGFNLHYERGRTGSSVVYVHGGFASLVILEGEGHSLVMRSPKPQAIIPQFIQETEGTQ
jgi:hypothetical protein